MAFDKRDYFYSDALSELSEIPDDEKERASLLTISRDKVPNDWIYDLLDELREMSKAKGVSLLDGCTPTNLARFTSRYNGDVWRY